MNMASSVGHIEKFASELPFREPADCPLDSCSSMRIGAAELARLRRVEAELLVALEREQLVVQQKDELIRHMDLLSRESDHRLMNGLQMVASLLSMQSRASEDEEASLQLKMAATRVATIGSVQRSLHALDHIESVDLTEYLRKLCHDICGMFESQLDGSVIDVEGVPLMVPSALGSSLGFIVSELVTNATKHASGKISVRIGVNPGRGYAVSVSDQGAGLPSGFDPTKMRGLGMKIILSLVKKIDGELAFSSGGNGSGLGARFSVSFDC